MRDPVKVTCHCGAVELRVRLSDGLATARRCNCSFCARRGAISVSAPLRDVEILRGAENLSLYTWGTHTAKHYFCSTCGIYTHHQRRSNPEEYGINMAAIEGIDPADFSDIPWIDGRNHPSDRTA